MKRTEKIIAYIKKKKSFCDYLELVDHFVEEAGYDESEILEAEKDECVLRYHEDSFIHRDNLIWDEKIQEKIEEISFLKFYEDPMKKDNYCGMLQAVIDEGKLPEINEELGWTPHLLGSLLDLSEYFEIIGPERKAFTPTPNKYGINDFEGLVFAILRNEFEERTTCDNLSRRLLESAGIEEKITEEMIEGSQRLKIEKGDIFISFPKHTRKKP